MFPLYDAPSQMEPLLPGEHRREALLEQASDLIRGTGQLAGMCQPGALTGLRALLRVMNSYYSNKIEGQHTLPLEIEQALHNDHSNQDLFARLPEADRLLPDGGGALQPGALRTQQVSIGVHAAPAADRLPAFLARWGIFTPGYGAVSCKCWAWLHRTIGWHGSIPFAMAMAAWRACTRTWCWGSLA